MNRPTTWTLLLFATPWLAAGDCWGTQTTDTDTGDTESPATLTVDVGPYGTIEESVEESLEALVASAQHWQSTVEYTYGSAPTPKTPTCTLTFDGTGTRLPDDYMGCHSCVAVHDVQWAFDAERSIDPTGTCQALGLYQQPGGTVALVSHHSDTGVTTTSYYYWEIFHYNEQTGEWVSVATTSDMSVANAVVQGRYTWGSFDELLGGTYFTNAYEQRFTLR